MPIILLLVIQGYVQNYVTHGQRLINQSVYVILMLAREWAKSQLVDIFVWKLLCKKVFAQFGYKTGFSESTHSPCSRFSRWPISFILALNMTRHTIHTVYTTHYPYAPNDQLTYLKKINHAKTQCTRCVYSLYGVPTQISCGTAGRKMQQQRFRHSQLWTYRSLKGWLIHMILGPTKGGGM